LESVRAGAAYADPDWSAAGSPKDAHVADLASMQPPADRLIDLVTRHVCRDLVLRLPVTVPVNSLRAWAPCEVESLIVSGRRMRFRHAYFGALARRGGLTEAKI
jgi:hypothetical protein